MATPAAPAAPGVGSFWGFSSALAGRPAVFAIVVLLLFLSARSDLEQPERHLESVKEQVILELSKSNEALEEQNRRLRIELLALRRSAREAGLVSVLTNSSLMGWPDETLGLAAAVGKEGPSGAAPGPPGAAGKHRRLLLPARTTASSE